VFVPATAIGDEVELSPLTTSKKKFARANAESIVEPGPSRIEPMCEHAGTCGGCNWQHMEYSAQLAAKEDIVRAALARIGGVGDLDALLRPIVASPSPFGYRARARWIEATNGGGVGYRAEGTNSVVAVSTCPILVPTANEALGALGAASRALAAAEAAGAADRAPSSALRHAPPREWTVSVGGAGAAAEAAQGASRPRLDVAVVHAADAAPREEGRSGGAQRRALRRPSFGTSAATAAARVDVLGETLRVSSASFLQGNALMWDALAAAVVDECVLPRSTRGGEAAPSSGSGGGDAVHSFVELFAGAGMLTLPLVRRGLSGVALECSDSAVDDLHHNLDALARRAPELSVDVDVVRGRVERRRHARELSAAMANADVVLLDPPRGGLHARVARLLAARGAQRLVYVSCDPATLARDVKVLVDEGSYAVASVTPLDLFPQTHHVECVARLERVVA
jgi:23S rRNA (uracil1939-C5)-methyltransferase